MTNEQVMDLFNKKVELLNMIYDNQVTLMQLINKAESELIEKRVDQNDLYIRQLNEINETLEDYLYMINRDDKDSHNALIQKIMRISKENIELLGSTMKIYKGKALNSTKNTEAHKIYVSNLK
jgi:hypothetical protein